MTTNKFTVELSDAQLKALAHVVYNPEEWIRYTISERCRIAMEEIFQIEVQRMLADPSIKEIPADREAVVLASDLKSAAQRQAEFDQGLPNGV